MSIRVKNNDGVFVLRIKIGIVYLREGSFHSAGNPFVSRASNPFNLTSSASAIVLESNLILRVIIIVVRDPQPSNVTQSLDLSSFENFHERSNCFVKLSPSIVKLPNSE